MSAEDSGNGRAGVPAEVPTGRAETVRGGGRDNVHPLAATKHGAYSKAVTGELQAGHLERLRERFPAADVSVLSLQASRLAQLDVIGAWLAERGIMRNRRTGTIYPAADYWARTASAFERQQERLEAQHDGASRDPADALRRHLEGLPGGDAA